MWLIVQHDLTVHYVYSLMTSVSVLQKSVRLKTFRKLTHSWTWWTTITENAW